LREEPLDLMCVETCSTEEKAELISRLRTEGGLHKRPC